MSAVDESLLPPALRKLLAREENWMNLIQVARWLKGARRFHQLALFTERLIRRRSLVEEPTAWHLHCQALVELGLLTTAESLLGDKAQEIAALRPAFDHAAIDLMALRGRIAKQRYFDLADRARDDRKSLLAAAAAYYGNAVKRAGTRDALRYFPAVNLVALAKIAEDNQWDLDIDGGSMDIAQSVIKNLKTTEAAERTKYSWWNATWAECQFALGEFKLFSEAVDQLVTAKKEPNEFKDERDRWRMVMPFESEIEVSEYQADAFMLASFIRQLNEVWNIQECSDPQVKEAMYKLNQAQMKREGGSIEIDAAKVKAYEGLEVSLGDEGSRAFSWIKGGIEATRSVAAVLAQVVGQWERAGTAFLVPIVGSEKSYALTSAHLISHRELNPDFSPMLDSPAEALLRFECLEHQPEHQVESIVWSSRIDEFDATLLLLNSMPKGAAPLKLSRNLPDPQHARVYVIGYPRGEELTISMNDNELLDHEALMENPPHPPDEPVRLHYRAPTAAGSGGSPVFEDHCWRVIALHHAFRDPGGTGLTLSGRRRYPRASEGISIASIGRRLEADTGLKLDFVD